MEAAALEDGLFAAREAAATADLERAAASDEAEGLAAQLAAAEKRAKEASAAAEQASKGREGASVVPSLHHKL